MTGAGAGTKMAGFILAGVGAVVASILFFLLAGGTFPSLVTTYGFLGASLTLIGVGVMLVGVGGYAIGRPASMGYLDSFAATSPPPSAMPQVERYCPSCGAGNPRASAYCHKCGKPLPPA